MYRLILISLILTSCSYQFHEKKFYQKGGTFRCEPDTVTRTDTIWKDGEMIIITNDSIIWKPVIEYIPKYVYKYRYLTEKSKEKESTKRSKIAARKDIKIGKSKEKTSRTKTRKENKWWYWLILGMPLGVLSYKLLGFSIKRIFK